MDGKLHLANDQKQLRAQPKTGPATAQPSVGKASSVKQRHPVDEGLFGNL
jgi:hypothetical protein